MSNIKDSNPKDAVGSRKAGLSCVPMPPLFEVGLSLQEGGLKYGRHNYRAIGVRASVYFDAAMRHLSQWWEGEDLDPDSGVSHVSKAIAGLLVLRDAQLQDKWTDDRPPISDPCWLEDMNAQASALVDKYPDPKDPYTAQSDD